MTAKPMMIDEAPALRLYGRRKGRPLRVRKSRLMEDLLPRLRIDLPFDHVRAFVCNKAFRSVARDRLRRRRASGGAGRAPSGAGFYRRRAIHQRRASPSRSYRQGKYHQYPAFSRTMRERTRCVTSTCLGRALFCRSVAEKTPYRTAFHWSGKIPHLARILKKSARTAPCQRRCGLIAWMREHMNAVEGFKCESDSSNPPKDWIERAMSRKRLKPDVSRFISAIDGFEANLQSTSTAGLRSCPARFVRSGWRRYSGLSDR